MPTATLPPTTPRLASIIRVDVLDFGPMRNDAIAYYCSLDKDRENWPDEKKNRIIISTESKWGRVQLENDSVYMLSEKGEGPRKPLGGTITCRVALYAAMDKHQGEEGWFESKPFAQVEIDDVNARSLPSIGGVQLEDFIKTRIPTYEAAYNEWRTVLTAARNQILAQRAKKHAQGQSQEGVKITKEPEAPAPQVAEGAPPIRKNPGSGGPRIKL